MRAVDIETSVEVEGSRAEVRRRLSEAVAELTHPAPGQTRDVVVLGSTTDSIRVRVDGEGIRGTLECALRPGLGVQGTAIDVRAHAEELPTVGRLLASVPVVARSSAGCWTGSSATCSLNSQRRNRSRQAQWRTTRHDRRSTSPASPPSCAGRRWRSSWGPRVQWSSWQRRLRASGSWMRSGTSWSATENGFRQ